MARPLFGTSFLWFVSFLICGCVSLTQEEAEPLKSAKPTVISTPLMPRESAGEQLALATPSTGPGFSKDEVKTLQAKLKASGFYVGPVDGLAGPKTRSALLQLQAACANLKDILETSTSETLQSTAAFQATKLDSAFASLPKGRDIRMVQVRLKDAGLEPGPIDGILGGKTKAAIFRLQAGCAMLKSLPATLDKDVRLGERQTSSIASAEKHNQFANPVTPVRKESGKISATGNQTLSNEGIRQEQMRLKDAGFDPGPIDGILGPKTKVARQQYEKVLVLKKQK